MARAHEAPLLKRPMLPGRSPGTRPSLSRGTAAARRRRTAPAAIRYSRRVMSRTAQRSRRRLASASPLTATSGSRGKRHQRQVCPATSYLPSTIAKETRGWPQAAAETPGLTWIHARYLDVLRGSGREEAGARRLFVALGAEVVPRLQQVGSFASPVQFWRSDLAEPQEAALETRTQRISRRTGCHLTSTRYSATSFDSESTAGAGTVLAHCSRHSISTGLLRYVDGSAERLPLLLVGEGFARARDVACANDGRALAFE